MTGHPARAPSSSLSINSLSAACSFSRPVVESAFPPRRVADAFQAAGLLRPAAASSSIISQAKITPFVKPRLLRRPKDPLAT